MMEAATIKDLFSSCSSSYKTETLSINVADNSTRRFLCVPACLKLVLGSSDKSSYTWRDLNIIFLLQTRPMSCLKSCEWYSPCWKITDCGWEQPSGQVSPFPWM